jgi:hypothetical protein
MLPHRTAGQVALAMAVDASIFAEFIGVRDKTA